MVQEKEFELDYVIKTTAELINDSEPVLNALMRFFENTQESYKEQRVLVENGELDPWDIAPVENEVDYELVEFVAQALNPVISHITKVIAERYKTNPADLYDGYFLQEYNREVYRMKYALHDKDGTRLEKNVFETIIRVAIAVAAVEGRYNNNSAVSAFASFFAVMALKYFIGGGRIMANAGSYLYKNSTTLINCTVMNQIPDSIDGIMDVAKQAALSLKSGAGVGYNFSTIRPKGAFVHGAGAETSGVISFMEIYDKTCNTIMSAGGRRGAQMATLHVEHPEIRSFITAKREDGILRNFNLSVLPTDKFMHAVENNENIDLWFWEKTDLEQIPEGAQGAYIKAGDIPYSHPDAEYFIFREGHAEVEYGNATPHTIFKKKIYETVPASEIYDLIMESTYDFAEPGFILIDRINEMNNLAPYGEHIQATNPCVTGDTIVPTLEGLKRIDELAGRNDLMTITDRRPNYDLFGTEISSAEAVYSGEKDVLEVVTEKGYSLRLTPDHLIYTPEYGYKEAGSLNVGDKISIQSGDNKMRKQGDQADAEQGFVLGALVHNGSFTTYTTEDGEEVPAYKARFSQAEQVSYTILHDTIMQATNGENMKYHTETDQEVGLQTIWYYDEAAVKWLQEIGAGDLKSIPENIINGSSKRAQAFLRGLFGTLGPIFDIDELPGKYKRKKGAVFVDRNIAKTTHLLLLDLGIPSHYIDLDTVFIVHSAKEQTLKYYMYNDTIVSIKPAGKEKVYDLKVPQEATFIANGIVVHNCTPAGTLVSTPKGFVPVETINEGDKISTALGTGRVKTVETFDNTPVYEVETSDGTVIRASEGHIFHTIRGQGKYFDNETRLMNLQIGDYIRVHAGTPSNNTVSATALKERGMNDKDIGFLVGVILGDGTFTDNHYGVKVTLGKHESFWLKELEQFFTRYGFDYANHTYDYSTATNLSLGSDVKADLMELGLEPNKASEKSLPLHLINTNKEFMVGFLDGIISTDGNVHTKKDNPMVRIKSASKSLLSSIQKVLNLLGIHGRIYSVNRKPTSIGDRKITNNSVWELVIMGSNLRSLYEQVTLRHKEKQERLTKLALNYNLTGETWKTRIVDIRYVGKETVYDLYEEKSDTWITECLVSRGCGEQPLPPNGSCNLGSVFLHSFVDNPFSPRATYRYYEYLEAVGIANRFLDNVNDITNLPLPSLRQQAWYKRRHGLGVTGVADMLAAMGYRYGAPKAISALDRIFGGLAAASLASNFYLAEQKGSAPIFLSKGPEKIKESKYIQAVVENIKKIPQLEFMHRKIVTSLAANDFLRYSHATSIAPTGTMSLTWGDNVANGIEPTFSHSYMRNTRVSGKLAKTQNRIFSAAYKWYLNIVGDNENMTNPDELIPTTDNVTLQAHIDTQAVAQKWIDSSVSKTCNIPTEFPFEDFKNAYIDAWKRGVKGFTTFRFNPNFSVGVLTRDNDLKNTKYIFTYTDENGVERELKVNGDDTIMYKGEKINASNLYEALKEKLLGKM